MRVEAKFKLFEEKKHSVRYNEVSAKITEGNALTDPVFRSVYISKKVLLKPFPPEITIEVRA
jgi:hypothetical protein